MTKRQRHRDRDRWLALDDEALAALCDLSFFKGTGRGGQKRNKTSSAIRLKHRPTGVAVTNSSSRSQHENRKKALNKLRMALAFTVRLDPSSENTSFPKRINRRNPEYPLWMARLLDILDHYDYHLRESAEHAGLSVNQLTRLASANTSLWQALNEKRRLRGLSTLNA